MKKFIFILFITLLSGGLLRAQPESVNKAKQTLKSRGEVYFSFDAKNISVNDLSRIISVDNVKNGEVFAYANQKEFDRFLEYGLDFQVLTPPSMLYEPLMRSAGNRETDDWDHYPTYEEYVAAMEQFQEDYPDLCELVNIGQTVENRDLLVLHINNDLENDQNEPEFFYTSTMHGDEVTGYVLMLHLIDYLLENYGTNDKVTNLVDNIDIWINPLANPDGTYAGGNNSVWGATRYNANWVDLNRNYKDPQYGDHPDGEQWQPETIAFMDFATAHHLVMSANFHGGAEVVNYPWDVWYRRHADDDWWIYVSREYADTAHAHSPNGYMTELDNGITNGYDWYSISGGRQDYMNYFQHCREVTIELSDNKTPPESQLLNYWEYNYRSLLNYMQQSLNGFAGVITDSETGDPLDAQVYITGHDQDESQVYSSLPVGDYHRPIKEGTYQVTFSKEEYYPQTIEVSATDNETNIVDVQLVPIGIGYDEFSAEDSFHMYPNPFSEQITFDVKESTEVKIFSVDGRLLSRYDLQKGTSNIELGFLNSGVYIVKAGNKSYRIVKK